MLTASTMNAWAESWTRFLVSSLVDATVVLFAVSILWLLIHKKASAQLGYSLFLLVLVKLLIPIEITVPAWLADLSPGYSVNRAVTWAARESGLPSLRSTSPGMTTAETGMDRPTTNSLAGGSELIAAKPGETQSRFSEPLTLAAILMIGWFTVVLILLGWFLAVQWKTRRIFLNSTEISPESLPVGFENLKEQAGVRKHVTLLTNQLMPLPASWGILKPRLILPSDLASSVSPEQLSWILLHELAHIRRSDLAVTLLQRILQILFFFNPAVWIANWVADQLREYACDDLALSTCDVPRKDCGKGFLSLLERVNNLPTVMTAPLGVLNYNTVIKRRMVRILDVKRNLKVGLSAGAVALLLPVAIVLLPSLRAAEEAAGAQPEVWVEAEGKPIFRKVRIPANPGNGVLSPDGRLLAFASEGSLWVVPISGNVQPDVAGEAVRLTEPMGASNRNNSLAWSANGNWIAFNVQEDQGNQLAVYVVPSSGGTPKKVTGQLDRGGHTYNLRVGLSPNGNVLSYILEDNSGPSSGPSRASSYHLFTVPVGGGEPIQLTVDNSSQPVFSPDGKWIAYIKKRINEAKDNVICEVWVVAVKGGEPKQITDFGSRARGPIWSPDGKMLAFSHEPDKDNHSDAVWIVPFSETGPSLEPPTKIDLPRENFDLLSGWTPDGRLGLFILSPRHQAVYTVPATGGKATQISPDGWPFHPRWSPDGKRVFFRWEFGGIASVPAEGGKVEPVPFLKEPKIVEVLPGGGNHVSPDGSTILFVAYKEGTDPLEIGIWTVAVEGGEPQEVSLDFVDDSRYREIRHPCWLSDGEAIGFLKTEEESPGNWVHNICVVSALGGEVRQLTDVQDRVAYEAFSGSPDGRWLAYVSTEKNLRLFSLRGGEGRVVTKVDSTHGHRELCWSPDASEIAYTEQGRIMVVPINGGVPREVETGILTGKADNWHLDWSPDGKKLVFSARLGGEPEFWFIENFLP